MSNNRIHTLGKPPDSEQPVNIQMANANGVVEMLFEPPITRMRLKPREARALAISMLIHADQAENPPPTILTPE